AAPFADARVGAVAGEKTVYQPDAAEAAAAGEGMYWKYESWLKRLDAEYNTIVGAAGELLALRTDEFIAVPEDTVIEDFVLSLKIAAKGLRVAYAPEALALEKASANVQEEQKRKVRISAGAFQAMQRLGSLLNPLRHG
ncbi:MAG TPA: glycosyl transferase, partial [Cytophagales bacterium]|nr:glycosyl transferase [Cytophagales bacterium]